MCTFSGWRYGHARDAYLLIICFNSIGYAGITLSAAELKERLVNTLKLVRLPTPEPGDRKQCRHSSGLYRLKIIPKRRNSTRDGSTSKLVQDRDRNANNRS